MITSRAFAGKHYAVLGLARSGLATVRALLASGARVTAWDSNVEARERAPDGTVLADLDEADVGLFDALVLSPGVPLNRSPLAARARAAEVPVIGDVELFARARRQLPPHKVVGITGTNGKSTTTALIHHILQAAGVPSLMGGNIGLPILGAEPLPEGGVYVLEVSSYQIDLTDSLDCEVAVLLNVTPDHLDRYDGFDDYVRSKARLFAMQSDGHHLVVDRASVSLGVLEGEDIPAGTVVSLIEDAFEGKAIDPSDQAHWPALQGPHNLHNVRAAVEVCDILGVDMDIIHAALASFGGLPHRMERVAERDGVLFVNDSKATNATAAAPALAAFPAVRWILGGQAKSDELDECAPFFANVRKAYTIGEAGPMFAQLLRPHVAVAECGTLRNAVKAAAADAGPGDTVLLSPACASFDQFRDFEARGEAFREAVGAL